MRKKTTDTLGDLFIRWRETGDREAFETVYKKVREALTAYLKKNFSQFSDADIDDIVSETIYIVAQKKETYLPSRGSFLSFACEIAKNKSLDESKKKMRRTETVEYDEALDANGIMTSAAMALDSPEEILLQKEDEEKLRAAMETLTERQRTAFYKCKIEHKGYKATAGEMHISVKQVYNYIDKAVANIKKFFLAEETGNADGKKENECRAAAKRKKR